MQNFLQNPRMGINADGLTSAQTGAPSPLMYPHPGHTGATRGAALGTTLLRTERKGGALGGCLCNPARFPQDKSRHA